MLIRGGQDRMLGWICPEPHRLSDRSRAACELSPLFLSACPFFDVGVDVSLLFEPVIVHLPSCPDLQGGYEKV